MAIASASPSRSSAAARPADRREGRPPAVVPPRRRPRLASPTPARSVRPCGASRPAVPARPSPHWPPPSRSSPVAGRRAGRRCGRAVVCRGLPACPTGHPSRPSCRTDDPAGRGAVPASRSYRWLPRGPEGRHAASPRPARYRPRRDPSARCTAAPGTASAVLCRPGGVRRPTAEPHPGRPAASLPSPAGDGARHRQNQRSRPAVQGRTGPAPAAPRSRGTGRRLLPRRQRCGAGGVAVAGRRKLPRNLLIPGIGAT